MTQYEVRCDWCDGPINGSEIEIVTIHYNGKDRQVLDFSNVWCLDESCDFDKPAKFTVNDVTKVTEDSRVHGKEAK